MNYHKLIGTLISLSSFYFLWVFPLLVIVLIAELVTGVSFFPEGTNLYKLNVNAILGGIILSFGIITYKGVFKGNQKVYEVEK